MTPQNKQLKGYKSERCMNCYHANKLQNSKIRCGIDDAIHWKDNTCNMFKYSDECFVESTEQPEAIAGEKITYESALDYLSEMGYGSGTNYTSKGVASLLADFASQQTSAKDKEIKELKQRISELEKLNEFKNEAI